jgi:small subunit ribosomal protein S16
MLMIRFQRIGRTNNAAFRIVVLEKERAAKSSRITDRLGTYNPHSKAVTIDADRAKEWLAKGAQPTDTVRNLFIGKGILAGKKVNALPSRVAKKKEEPVVEAPKAEAPKADVAPAEAPVAEAEAAPTEAAA